MKSRYIQLFLDHFSYLDKDNKRSGFLFFNNKNLTANLELLACDLQSNLAQLQSQDSIEEMKRINGFIALIRKTFQDVEKAREFHAPIENEFTIYGGDTVRWDKRLKIDIDYKMPYKPSKFERELINGLQAIVDSLTSTNNTLTQQQSSTLAEQCRTLISDINDFQPKRLDVEDRTFVP